MADRGGGRGAGEAAGALNSSEDALPIANGINFGKQKVGSFESRA